MSVCRHCTKTIRWVATTGGRRMAIDPDPVPSGSVVIMDGRARVLMTADQLAQRGLPTQRWMPHAVTCPEKPTRRR